MNERIVSALESLPDYLSRHVLLCATALAFGIVTALPLAVLAAHAPRTRTIVQRRIAGDVVLARVLDLAAEFRLCLYLAIVIDLRFVIADIRGEAGICR